MLAGNFFELASMNSENGRLTGVIKLNAAHTIFDGHFPGQPVVPGVCMMQMVKEVFELELGASLRLEVADQVKFLSVINPLETSSIRIEIAYTPVEDGRAKMSATLLNEGIIYFKLRAIFKLTE